MVLRKQGWNAGLLLAVKYFQSVILVLLLRFWILLPIGHIQHVCTHVVHGHFFFHSHLRTWNDAQQQEDIKSSARRHQTPQTSVLSLLAAMSLEDSFAIDPEDSGVLVLNVSRVLWDSTGNQHQYNIWLPGVGIAAVYGIIIIVGLVGNVTLMKTCLSVKSMRTVPNLFLSSLALGDLLLLVTCAPVDASRYLVDQWLFGRVGCKLIPFIQLTSVGVSVFTLTALSADRYFSHSSRF